MVFYLKQDLADKMFIFEKTKTEIKDSRFGKTISGAVAFQSGFLVSIDAATLNERTYKAIINNENCQIESEFSLRGVNIAYDVHYDLHSNFKGDAVFLIRYENFHFHLVITQIHNEKAKGFIQYVGVNSGGQYSLIVKIDPDIPEAQLIARNLRYNPNFRGQTERFFENWNLPLQAALVKAVADIDFPKIDYFH
ncbi:uncharacterized protein LOC116339061 isoform X2 [Contarinia nasturtii]|nr:uncharacterized protein LOC116339061 isoform X2 [Contarinia nasturtii]